MGRDFIRYNRLQTGGGDRGNKGKWGGSVYANVVGHQKNQKSIKLSEININNIFWELLTKQLSENDCDHSKYRQWENETSELKSKLIKRGKIDIRPKTWKNDEYWGENAPIKFSWYPFHSCEIHQCLECKEFFFHYIEHGGHGSQKRYRIIDLELIDKKDYNPEKRAIIDYNGFEYSVYKYPSNELELVTCRGDVGIGIDIARKLDESETEEYYTNGITNFEDTLKEMKINYSNYRVTSWR